MGAYVILNSLCRIYVCVYVAGSSTPYWGRTISLLPVYDPSYLLFCFLFLMLIYLVITIELEYKLRRGWGWGGRDVHDLLF